MKKLMISIVPAFLLISFGAAHAAGLSQQHIDALKSFNSVYPQDCASPLIHDAESAASELANPDKESLTPRSASLLIAPYSW